MENDRPKRPIRHAGGQHQAPIGDSTLHHRNPWDFSVHLASMGGQHKAPQGGSTRDDERLALWLFEQERQQYAGQADVAW